jgi:predicted DNA-binding transcriptional regulator AlpA
MSTKPEPLLSVEVDLISIPETASRTGLHANTLYRLCRSG